MNFWKTGVNPFPHLPCPDFELFVNHYNWFVHPDYAWGKLGLIQQRKLLEQYGQMETLWWFAICKQAARYYDVGTFKLWMAALEEEYDNWKDW